MIQNRDHGLECSPMARWSITKTGPFSKACELVAAEGCLKDAFSCRLSPVIRDWGRSRGCRRPMDAFRQSGYLERSRRTQRQEPGIR